ncbi:hypothetical protein MKW94_018211 [Papaver nudicaule]|uniref:Uncharacterized protein n=1 Tax=Papaver nudicaule TaxID=74823 RepID=A0AA41V522_PAPNU|nr:hypothetical protein [Papaver nudicaule]
MARILIVCVLILMSISQNAFSQDLKLGRKGDLVEVERHGSVGQNLGNGQVNQGGGATVVVAGGLAKVKSAGTDGTDLENGKAVFVDRGGEEGVAYGLVETHEAQSVGVNLPGSKTKAKDASAENYHG